MGLKKSIHPPFTEEPQLHSPQEKILCFFLKLHINLRYFHLPAPPLPPSLKHFLSLKKHTESKTIDNGFYISLKKNPTKELALKNKHMRGHFFQSI